MTPSRWSIPLEKIISTPSPSHTHPHREAMEKAQTYTPSFLRISARESPTAIHAPIQLIHISRAAVIPVLAGRFADFVAGALFGEDLLLDDDFSQSGHGFQDAVLAADEIVAFDEGGEGAGDGSASLGLVGAGAEVAGEI